MSNQKTEYWQVERLRQVPRGIDYYWAVDDTNPSPASLFRYKTAVAALDWASKLAGLYGFGNVRVRHTVEEIIPIAPDTP